MRQHRDIFIVQRKSFDTKSKIYRKLLTTKKTGRPKIDLKCWLFNKTSETQSGCDVKHYVCQTNYSQQIVPKLIWNADYSKNRFVDILFVTRMVFERNGLNAGIFYKSELVCRNWKMCRNEFPSLKHLATFDDFGNSSEARSSCESKNVEAKKRNGSKIIKDLYE